MSHWDIGSTTADQQVDRYERQSRQQSGSSLCLSDPLDALIDTQKENIEALQRQIVALKRRAEDADGKLLIEADRAAKAEAQSSRLEKDARAFAIVKSNLETAVARQEDRLKDYEKQCKKLQNGAYLRLADLTRAEVDASAQHTDAQHDADRRKLDARVNQLERELQAARSQTSTAPIVGPRVAELEARISSLQSENESLHSTAPAKVG